MIPLPELEVMWDPMIEPLNTADAVEAFHRTWAAKALKVDEYSDGSRRPVWLALAVHSVKQRFLSLSLVQELARTNGIDPSPFSRILVGCYTAGVTFIDGTNPPRYTSLSTTG